MIKDVKQNDNFNDITMPQNVVRSKFSAHKLDVSQHVRSNFDLSYASLFICNSVQSAPPIPPIAVSIAFCYLLNGLGRKID